MGGLCLELHPCVPCNLCIRNRSCQVFEREPGSKQVTGRCKGPFHLAHVELTAPLNGTSSVALLA